MKERGVSELTILCVENGFIVKDYGSEPLAKKWAFESAESLSAFVMTWGEGNTKTTTNVTESR